MKAFSLLLCLALLTLPTMAQDRPPDEITLTGRLAGGQMAVGGETTGWVLRYRDEQGPRSVDVAFPAALLTQARDGAFVRLTGTIEQRQYLERGTVPTLVVKSLEDLPSP